MLQQYKDKIHVLLDKMQSDKDVRTQAKEFIEQANAVGKAMFNVEIEQLPMNMLHEISLLRISFQQVQNTLHELHNKKDRSLLAHCISNLV